MKESKFDKIILELYMKGKHNPQFITPFGCVFGLFLLIFSIFILL